MVPRIVCTNGYPDAEAHAAWLMRELLIARRETTRVHLWNGPEKRASWARRVQELEHELRVMSVSIPADSA